MRESVTTIHGKNIELEEKKIFFGLDTDELHKFEDNIKTML
jgi:hypothetical protein